MASDEPLIPKHGGYRGLKSFRVAQLAYDVTVLFCDRFVDRFSRTRDQMVQAARSGVQNIAEGSQASGTSKKTELKLTNVARASLEELRLDYEDFLRQRGLPMLPPEHPALVRFKERRCATLAEVQAWVAEERRRQSVDEHGLSRTDTDKRNRTKARLSQQEQPPTNTDERARAEEPQSQHDQPPANTHTPERQPSVPVPARPCSSISSAALAANAALSLLNLACHLLDRQLAAQAASFEEEGGFTERLYRVRSTRRRPPSGSGSGRP